MVLKVRPGLPAALALLAAAATPQPAQAEGAYIGANMGIANVVKGERSSAFGLEYRGAPLIWTLRPIVGGFATHRGAAYGYAGFGVDVRLTSNLLIRGNTAIGAYAEGNDIDLGHVVEFRSGVELVVELPNKAQLGFSFHHLSNAGLGDDNPGTEIVAINYAIPLDTLFTGQ